MEAPVWALAPHVKVNPTPADYSYAAGDAVTVDNPVAAMVLSNRYTDSGIAGGEKLEQLDEKTQTEKIIEPIENVYNESGLPGGGWLLSISIPG
jgi:hypothetical protein